MANPLWHLGAKSWQDDSYNSQQTPDFCESKNVACCRRPNVCGPTCLRTCRYKWTWHPEWISLRASSCSQAKNERAVLQAREFGLKFRATLHITLSTNKIHKWTRDITKTSTRCSFQRAIFIMQYYICGSVRYYSGNNRYTPIKPSLLTSLV